MNTHFRAAESALKLAEEITLQRMPSEHREEARKLFDRIFVNTGIRDERLAEFVAPDISLSYFGNNSERKALFVAKTEGPYLTCRDGPLDWSSSKLVVNQITQPKIGEVGFHAVSFYSMI